MRLIQSWYHVAPETDDHVNDGRRVLLIVVPPDGDIEPGILVVVVLRVVEVVERVVLVIVRVVEVVLRVVLVVGWVVVVVLRVVLVVERVVVVVDPPIWLYFRLYEQLSPAV